MPEWTVIATMVTAVGGLLMGAAALFNVLNGKAKSRADAVVVLSDTALKLVNPLQARIDLLETRDQQREKDIQKLTAEVALRDNKLILLTKEIAELHAGIKLLSYQILALGQKPIYQPATP